MREELAINLVAYSR